MCLLVAVDERMDSLVLSRLRTGGGYEWMVRVEEGSRPWWVGARRLEQWSQRLSLLQPILRFRNLLRGSAPSVEASWDRTAWYRSASGHGALALSETQIEIVRGSFGVRTEGRWDQTEGTCLSPQTVFGGHRQIAGGLAPSLPKRPSAGRVAIDCHQSV